MNTPLHLNKFLASGVGSLPFANPQEACDLIFKHLGDALPFWPQLPKRNFKENMYAQFSQGLPGVVIDEDRQGIYIDTSRNDYTGNLEAAYEHYLSEDLDYFSISEDYACGLYEFVSRQSAVSSQQYIKGHTIGPISFGLTVTDQNKQASVYNQEFRDCMVKVLAVKARWQIRKLRSAAGSARIIIFIDEPYLVSIGSSFFNIQAGDVIAMLNEVIEGIHQEAAYAGIHCCGNTDWSIVLKTGIDILNYDSYNYLDSIFLYRKELDGFLKRGGVLAWGIIPNSAEGELPDVQGLLERFDKFRPYLKTPGLITPSCGLSGVSPESSQRILSLTRQTAEILSSQ